MKTRYKHIYFDEVPTMIVEEHCTWFCRNNKTDDVLGTLTYYSPWKRWVFEGEQDCLFDESCLADIIHFIKQLKGL